MCVLSRQGMYTWFSTLLGAEGVIASGEMGRQFLHRCCISHCAVLRPL